MKNVSKNKNISLIRIFLDKHKNPGIVLILSILTHSSVLWVKQEIPFPTYLIVTIAFSYLIFAIIDSYILQHYMNKGVKSPYSVTLGINLPRFEHALKQQQSTLNQNNWMWNYHLKYNGLKDFDWQFYDSRLFTPKDWQLKIIEIRNHFFLYSKRISHDIPDLHIFLRVPAAIALGLGHTIGKKMPCSVYNFSNEKKSYELLPKQKNSNDESFRENQRFIQVKRFNNKRKVKFIPSSINKVSIILSFTNTPKNKLPNTEGGEIKVYYKIKSEGIPEYQFESIANEIATLINNQIKEKERSIDLYAGVPITLAFLLGSKLEEDSPITLWNLNNKKNKWESVCSLDELYYD